VPLTYEEIERGWLAGGRIPITPEEVVAAFDRCERILGRGWIDQSRGNTHGPAPTLSVVIMGQRLASLHGLARTDQLIEKVRNGDPSAYAELHAIHLLACDRQTEFELFPEVEIKTRQRVPDFRAKRDGSAWVYVEVTRPEMSEVAERAQATLNALAAVVSMIIKPIALEVFLRREPTDEELDALPSHITTFCSEDTSSRGELPNGLGLLIHSEHPPGMLILTDHVGEEVSPRLGAARMITGSNEPTRHVMVRMPYSDARAERFISREAAQLPPAAPGLIMVDMTETQTGFASWEPLVNRRFQPAIHTRVGGVCLFSSGTLPTQDGLAVLSQTKLLLNPHANIVLPRWVDAALTSAGAEFKRVIDSKRDAVA
jgi:hypothetical protein